MWLCVAAETLDRDEKDRVVRWLLICRMDWDRLLRGFLGVMKEFSLCVAKEPSLGLWWSSMVGVEGDDVLLMMIVVMVMMMTGGVMVVVCFELILIAFCFLRVFYSFFQGMILDGGKIVIGLF